MTYLTILGWLFLGVLIGFGLCAALSINDMASTVEGDQ